MKKITLFMTLFIAATMSIFAQDAPNELRLLNTIPSSNDDIEGFVTSWEFIFSEKAKVADNAVKELEIKNEANEIIACVGLTGVGTYDNSIFTGIVADTIWNEWYDEKTGETNKYYELTYPTGLDVPGIYTMTIPAGTFVSAQDNSIAIAETTLTFNVVAPKPNWWTDYDYTTTVREFETITIGFENVKEVKLNEGVLPMLFTAAGSEYIGTAELVKEVDEKDGKTTYRIKISFGEKFSEEGLYYVTIPAEMFTMNNEVSNEEKQINLEILAPVEVTPLEFVSITPTEGNVNEIGAIVITFNQQIGFVYDENWQVVGRDIYLTDANGNTITLTQTGSYMVGYNQIEYAYLGDEPQMNEYWFYQAVPITTSGTYTLDLSQILVTYGYDNLTYTYNASGAVEKTITWTIGDDTAVEGIEAEAENAEIYDLTGRRVEKITNAGIYIVNGVKKVIK